MMQSPGFETLSLDFQRVKVRHCLQRCGVHYFPSRRSPGAPRDPLSRVTRLPPTIGPKQVRPAGRRWT